MDVDGLRDPAVTFFSYRVDGELLVVGALKRLDEHHAEIKSMHTARAARGRGLGRLMVEHLIAVARERGYERSASRPARCRRSRRRARCMRAPVRRVRAVLRLPGEP